jgi:hypothetical protein
VGGRLYGFLGRFACKTVFSVVFYAGGFEMDRKLKFCINNHAVFD